jgi:hypothetical protein
VDPRRCHSRIKLDVSDLECVVIIQLYSATTGTDFANMEPGGAGESAIVGVDVERSPCAPPPPDASSLDRERQRIRELLK